MPHGQIKTKCQAERDHLETAQVVLFNLSMDIEEILLRNRQAMRRSSLVADVLDPAIERLVKVQADLKLAQDELKQAWLNGQARRWEKEDEHGT